MPPPTMPTRRRELSAGTTSILAGSAAGMASVAVCHPFDTLRTRLQISPERFRGLIHCTTETIRRESIGALYKGFGSPFLSQAVYKSVIFTTSSRLREDVLPRLTPWMTPSVLTLTSGAVAGGLNALIVAPVELIRNRLQVQYENDRQSRRYQGTWHCITRIWRTEGLGAFWRGLGTTVLRDGLGCACYFLGYEAARRRLAGLEGMNETTVLLTAGAFGGISFWAIALPFDTIKSLIQVDAGRGHYAGLRATATRLVREHGAAHLFRGWQAAFTRGVPSAAITFWTYDRVTRALTSSDGNDAP